MDSRIRIYANSASYLSLDYASLAVEHSDPGERIRDRNGLVHRIAPSVERYPVAARLSLLPEELSRLAHTTPVALSAQRWLEAQFRIGASLLLFCESGLACAPEDSFGANAQGGAAATETSRLALRVVIEAVPQGYAAGLWQIGDKPLWEPAEYSLHVAADGEFSDFDDVDSAEWRERP